jgi:hypothetical protein
MSLRSKWAAGKAVRAGLAVGGRISKLICNRRATQPLAPFQRNHLGRGQLAVFPRCSLDPYQSRYGHFTASPARTGLKTRDFMPGFGRNTVDGELGKTFDEAGVNALTFSPLGLMCREIRDGYSGCY